MAREPQTTQAPLRTVEGSSPATDPSRALQLLQLESEAREQRTVPELLYHLANVSRKVLPFRQAFILRRRGRKAELETVSSMAVVERDAPMTRWLQELAGRILSEDGGSSQRAFEPQGYSGAQDPEGEDYPFRFMLSTPLNTAKGDVFALLITARETPWSDAEKQLTSRIANHYAHAWRALVGERRVQRGGGRLKRVLWPAIGLGVLACGFIPVPLTAIAPMTVAPAASTVVAAGIDGVVEEIAIGENSDVAAEDVLLRYESDEFLNALRLAERRLAVAEARYLRARQGAVTNPDAKADIAITAAEYELALAERDFAKSRTEDLIVRAPVAGVAVFNDRREWTGRPVQVGERIMEIAEPGGLFFEIELGVDDAVVLEPGARVRIFLDSAPLSPVEARLTRGAYEATPHADGRLAYTLIAEPAELPTQDDADAPAPRIGTRGTAQVFGRDVPLALFLFRRPITAVRQQLGF